MKSTFRATLLVLLATSAFTIPARAEDLPPVVAALFGNLEKQINVKPTYEKLETDSSGNITISNMAVSYAAMAGGPQINYTVKAISFENIGAEADGIIKVGKSVMTDLQMNMNVGDGQNVTVELPSATAEDWYVPVLTENPTPLQELRANMSIARKASAGEFKFSTMGQTFTAKGMELTWDGDPVTGAGKSAIKLTDLVIPEAAISAGDPTGQMKQLGYADLTLNFSAAGELAINGETFGMNGNIDISGRDMGGFKFAFGASELPISALAELQAAERDKREPNMNALMPQLMNVTIGDMHFRFEDASITRKLLPIIAKMQGMDEAAMVANASAMLQISMMQLKNQAFTDQVVGAVSAFLKDPKSITIAIKPASPVKVQQMMTLDPNNPAAAIDLLGVSVTAND